MTGSHIQYLTYTAGPNREGLAYRNARPVKRNTPVGRFLLDGGKPTVWPAEHFATAEEARAVVQPYLDVLAS
jgi:hypothetical protein